ncbi:DegQ family serine endoprotease [candidate division KSB1 bacterium]
MRNKRGILLSGVLFILLGIFIGYGITQFSGTDAVTRAQYSSDRPQTQKDTGLMSFNEAFVSVAERANPSVVTIFTEKIIKQSERRRSPFSNDPFFERFFGMPSPEQKGLGSGVIIRKNGYIITNNHVIKDADVVKVKLKGAKEKEYKAEIIGRDPKTDIAVIKIDIDNLPVIPIGDSDKLRVGEWVMAIGSPFGEELAHTVTAGIVSAKGRSSRQFQDLADYADFIQTDASINPGNSGGALVNLKGELIGINSAIISGSRGFQGVGLAVPINMGKEVVEQLIDHGKVIRGWLGVYIQDVDENMANVLDLKDLKGAIVPRVPDDSPADKAGIKAGDIIVKINGEDVLDSDDLRKKISATAPGTVVTLTIIRDEKEKRIDVKLGELPADDSVIASAEKEQGSIGITVEEITRQNAEDYKFDSDEKGVVITNVVRGSVAERSYLREGDIIKKINRTNIGSVKDYKRVTKKLESGDSVLMFIKTPGVGTRFVSFEIPEE